MAKMGAKVGQAEWVRLWMAALSTEATCNNTNIASMQHGACTSAAQLRLKHVPRPSNDEALGAVKLSWIHKAMNPVPSESSE